MSSDPERRMHTTTRAAENFNEDDLSDLTGQYPKYWARYAVKELLDNSLDFAEEMGRIPGIHIEIGRKLWGPYNHERITRVLVRDNGPGIPESRLERICENIGEFGGTKRHYALTTRGNQGNALMTLIGIQFLCNGPLRIATQGSEYRIRTTEVIDGYNTTLETVGESDVAGTLVEIDFGEKAKNYGKFAGKVTATVEKFVDVNPHAEFTIINDYEEGECTESLHSPVNNSTQESLTLPGSATTGKATWFSSNGFRERVKADITAEPTLPIEDFVGEFLGVSGRTNRNAVLDTFDQLCGPMSDEDVAVIDDLATGDPPQLRDQPVETLRQVLCSETSTFSEKKANLRKSIGSVGKDLCRRVSDGTDEVFEQLQDAGEADTIGAENAHDLVGYYAGGDVVESDDIHDKTTPFYFELAVAPTGIVADDEESDISTSFGVNQSVTYSPPKFSPTLDVRLLNGNERSCYHIEDAFRHLPHNFDVTCNLTCPNVDFGDKGKQDFDTGPFGDVIEDVVEKAVRKMENDIRPRLNAVVEASKPDPEPEPDKSLAGRADKSFIGDFIFDHFWEVYNTATDNGRFSLTMRDFFYAIEPLLLEEADRRGYKYRWNSPADDPKPFRFTQQTSNKHVKAFEEEEIGHRLLERDDRGFFVEPHKGQRIPLGTSAVDAYDETKVIEEIDALLYIEKTGRMDILERTEIAKEYDIGVINGKGYPTIANRNLVDNIQRAARDADRKITLFTVTDFDVNGLLIRDDIKNPDDFSEVDQFDVTHLGLTLDDIEEWDLLPGPVDISSDDQTKLTNAYERGDVSEDEYEFLLANGGQRVEINALPPVQLIEYLEEKFERLGIEKVEPEDADEVDVPDVRPPETIRDETIKQEIGDFVVSKLWDGVSFDEFRDDVLSEVDGADEIRSSLEDADIPVPIPPDEDKDDYADEEDDDEESEIAADIYDQICEDLKDNPPKHWEELNMRKVREYERTAREISTDYTDDIKDDIGKWLDSVNFTVGFEEEDDED